MDEMKRTQRPAKAFSLKSQDGRVSKLDDFKGKLVVLHFWASWCAPCLEEIPRLYEASRNWDPNRIALVAVTVDKKWADAEKILQKHGAPPASWKTLIDPQSEIAESYGTFEFPETYLISPDQKILYKWVGPQDWKADDIQKLFSEMLSISKTKSAPQVSKD